MIVRGCYDLKCGGPRFHLHDVQLADAINENEAWDTRPLAHDIVELVRESLKAEMEK